MKHRILVVDDEEKLRRVIELQLSAAGFDVDKAASAEEDKRLINGPPTKVAPPAKKPCAISSRRVTGRR